jgi:hypothetical protein
MLKAILKRNSDDGVQTLGELTIKSTTENGQEITLFHCLTLERPWKDNKSEVSCIPKGDYICKWTFSPRLVRYTYQIMNVKDRTGIRFHSGNYFFDVIGCIILGHKYADINKDGEVDILETRQTIKEFETLLNKQDFNLSII